jgi:membrane carboxypeptidase/penicillin-binding protein PbpC
LLPNHSITWYLNGAPLTEQAIDAVNISLKQLARGAYTISASVSDAVTGESRTSDSVNFYVREPSALSPQHK